MLHVEQAAHQVGLCQRVEEQVVEKKQFPTLLLTVQAVREQAPLDSGLSKVFLKEVKLVVHFVIRHRVHPYLMLLLPLGLFLNVTTVVS